MSDSRLCLRYLSEEALDQIEETAYRLLAEVGIALHHPVAAEMLCGRGCRLDRGRVFIPDHVVQWALQNVSGQKHEYRMDGSPGFDLGDGLPRFHNGGGPPFAYDLDTGLRRQATLDDLAAVTCLLDALPNVDVVIPLFAPQDVPPELLVVASTETMLRNTRKPVSSAAIDKPEQVGYVVEMAAACAGKRQPSISMSVSPVSPLTFTHDVTAAILAVVRSGAVLHPLPAPSLGATGPITLAGSLAQQHAENLASLVIAAVARPGATVVYCSRINPIDLRTAVSSWGGPEVGMAAACASQLAHRLGLPCDAYGLCTSTGLLDPQFAYERLANALVPAAAGVDILSGVGIVDSGLAGGLEVAVIDDEIIGLIRHIVAGVEVTEETLALDVMKQVIAGDGVFLSHRHTARQARLGALWVPTVSDRGTGERRMGVVARARARAREILLSHQVEPLPDDVSRQLDEISARARRDLVGE